MRWRLTPVHRRHSFTYANGQWETLVFVYCITEKRFLLHWYAPVLFEIAAPFSSASILSNSAFHYTDV